MKLTLTDIARHLTAQLIGESMPISSVSIDTRTLQPGDLYIAINGKNFDGHDFIPQAEIAGAAALMVDHLVDTDLPQLIVPNTRIGLAELAGLWRQSNQAKIIAVTGSNGKTTLKEMLASILSVQAPVLATKGNLNNDIGVPLTLLRLNEEHQYAVIEMGANHAGEIAFSSRYAQADIGVINNVGAAHLEGFGSLEGVAEAKGEIISGLPINGIAVLNRDDEFFPLWQDLAGKRQIISFGFNPEADIRAEKIESHIDNYQFQTRFTLLIADERVEIELKLAGSHNVKNALAAAAAVYALGIDTLKIKQGLEKLNPVTGRLQPLISRLGNIVIDDTYNANPASLAVALEVLRQCVGEKWLILGAFGELGADSEHLHTQMGYSIKAAGVQRLFATGMDARFAVEAFGAGATFYERQTDLIRALQQELTGHEGLLIKGSRSQRMENVAQALVENFRTGA